MQNEAGRLPLKGALSRAFGSAVTDLLQNAGHALCRAASPERLQCYWSAFLFGS
jgi:hypothetical protein